MLKELLSFAWHAPKVYYLSRTLPHAELYDLLMLRAEQQGMAQWRRELVQDMSGRILEIGCGTGLMFRHYGKDARVAAIEPFADFVGVAKQRRQSNPASITLTCADGQSLPFRDDQFDFVVVGLVMCSVDQPEAFLREIRRTLKPTGELRLIEHVISDKPASAYLMDKLNPIWLQLNKQNCHMNRTTEAVIRANGFDLVEARPFKLYPKGIPAFPMRWMRAVPRT